MTACDGPPGGALLWAASLLRGARPGGRGRRGCMLRGFTHGRADVGHFGGRGCGLSVRRGGVAVDHGPAPGAGV